MVVALTCLVCPPLPEGLCLPAGPMSRRRAGPRPGVTRRWLAWVARPLVVGSVLEARRAQALQRIRPSKRVGPLRPSVRELLEAKWAAALAAPARPFHAAFPEDVRHVSGKPFAGTRQVVMCPSWMRMGHIGCFLPSTAAT